MNKNTLLRMAAALAVASGVPRASGEIKLPKIIASHMVLQRDRPIHLWGWAAAGEQVSAELQGATQNTLTDALGRWSLFLAPHPAGGPYTLTIKGTNSLLLEDVMVGDVWLASGQSNMEMPLSGFPGNAVLNNAAEEIRTANQPNIRLLLVKQKASLYPLKDFEKAEWTACTPETAAHFSAVAYLFGRQIAEQEHVPIGLIDSTWGGTPVEAWVSMDGLASDSSLMPVFGEWAKMANEQAEMPDLIAEEKRQDAEAKKAQQPAPHHPWHPNPDSWAPAALYNGMIAPAVKLRMKGVIWYQGESNASEERANLYEKAFPALINDWRGKWQEGDFPFLFVQLASFKAGPRETWPIVREAQRRTLRLVRTGMAVTIDIGDPNNVHPSNKQDVAARLALAARALAYDESLEYSGPLYRETSTEGEAIRVWFTHTAAGLVAKGGPLSGFEVAGEDLHFVLAAARIEGENVVVSSEQVKAPKYVRYGWADMPDVNLYNGQGLPASPFTSESNIPRP